MNYQNTDEQRSRFDSKKVISDNVEDLDELTADDLSPDELNEKLVQETAEKPEVYRAKIGKREEVIEEDLEENNYNYRKQNSEPTAFEQAIAKTGDSIKDFFAENLLAKLG